MEKIQTLLSGALESKDINLEKTACEEGKYDNGQLSLPWVLLAMCVRITEDNKFSQFFTEEELKKVGSEVFQARGMLLDIINSREELRIKD